MAPQCPIVFFPEQILYLTQNRLERRKKIVKELLHRKKIEKLNK